MRATDPKQEPTIAIHLLERVCLAGAQISGPALSGQSDDELT